MSKLNTTWDMGNNESKMVGIVPQNDGTFLVLGGYSSKFFKTLRGAKRYADKQGIRYNL